MHARLGLQHELLMDVDDGIVVGLYHYLWMKDGKGRSCPEVNIPHTVSWQGAYAWTWPWGNNEPVSKPRRPTRARGHGRPCKLTRGPTSTGPTNTGRQSAS